MIYNMSRLAGTCKGLKNFAERSLTRTKNRYYLKGICDLENLSLDPPENEEMTTSSEQIHTEPDIGFTESAVSTTSFNYNCEGQIKSV